MTRYRFQCVVGTDVVDSGPPRDFDALDDARAEARALLGKLAAHALATRDVDMVSIHILDETEAPITELRLVFEEILK